MMDRRLHRKELVSFILFVQLLSAWPVLSNYSSTASIDAGCGTLTALHVSTSPGNYNPEMLTPNTCALLCAKEGTKLAGATNGKICLCGNTVQASLNGTCDQSCTGDSSVSCGGQTEFSVYNISALLRNAPDLQFHTKPKLYEAVSFQVNLVNDTSIFKYHVTSNAVVFLDKVTFDLTFGSRYEYTFTTWGDDVQMSVVVFGKLIQEYKKTIQVDVPLKVSSLFCPSYVTVGQPFECSGKLYLGKDVNVTWELDGISNTMPLSDPVSLYVGIAVTPWNITFGGAALANGLVLCRTCGVNLPVLIHGWEMNVNKSGTVVLAVLRPSCSSGMMYCPAVKACCTLSYEFSTHLCNQENSFCGSIGLCSSSISQPACLDSIPNNVSLSNSYNIVYNITLVVQKGYNVKLLPSDGLFEYRPGDILGWIKSDTSATFAIDPRNGELTVLTNVADISNNLISLTADQQAKKQVGTALIAGIASKANGFLLNMTVLSSKGIRNVTFTHDMLNSERLTTIRSVHAQNLVGNISFGARINSNSCVHYYPLNESFNVSLYIGSGTRVVVIWELENTTVTSYPYKTFGDQEEIYLTQNFTISSIGKYLLTVMVANDISGRIIKSEMIIQEKITGLTAEVKFKTEQVFQGIKTGLIASFVTGTNVSFRWYFGDGSETKLTTQGTIDHEYHILGLVTTIVEAFNMVSAVNVSIQLNVSNPIEIILPPFGVNGSSLNITCTLPENFTEDYAVVFQIENSSMTSTNCNTIQHTFLTGSHDIRCLIQLAVIVSVNASLFVFEPITGLEIRRLPPTKLGETGVVEADLKSGNNVSYLWKVLGNSYNLHISNATSINFTSVGQIKVSLNASNAISMKYTEMFVTVQEPLGNLTVSASSNPGKSMSNILFNISKTSGTDVNYTVNISDSFRDLGPSSTFAWNMFSEGLYNIFVLASNLISQSNTTYRMAVQDPLVYPLNISCPILLREDGVCVVETNRALQFQATVTYATNVTFMWLWSGQETQNTSDENPSVVKPRVTATASHTFDRVEKYNLSVYAKNDVSNTGNWLSVHTLDKVEGFSFVAKKFVAVNESFTVNISLSKGSNVTFSFNTGDTSPSVVTSGNETQWNYTKPGVFLVKGIAKNLISNATDILRVIVQERIKAISFVEDETLVVKTNDPVSIQWKIFGGTNVSTTSSIGYSEEIKCSIMSPVVLKCEHQIRFSSPGLQNVTIEAYNLLDTKPSVQRTYSVQDVIEGLSISTPSPYADVHTDINVTISITKGTEVKYQISLNDKYNTTVNTSEPYAVIRYEKEGIYNFLVAASNDVSKSAQWFKINITVPPEPVKIEGLSLSGGPTIFGQSTMFKVSYTKGALFTCHAKFTKDGNSKDYSERQVNKPIFHKYNEPGNYDVELTCSNRLNSPTATTAVSVHEEIKEFNLNTSYIAKTFPSKFDIVFVWRKGSHMKIVALEKGKKSKEASIDKSRQLGRISFAENYLTIPGYHTIYVNASNSVSSIQKTFTIRLTENISGVEILVNPYVPVGYHFISYLSYAKGSDLKVTWSFGDGNVSVINCTWKETCSTQHFYKKTGRYFITANITNEISTGFANASLLIQYPIFGWTFSSVNKSLKGSPSFVALNYNASFPFPSSATYEIRYGKAKTPKKSLTGGSSVVEAHTFLKAGCYKADVTIENAVNTVVLSTEIEVFGDIDDPEVTARSLLKNKDSSSVGLLPIEYPVNFESNLNNNCLKYNWTIRNRTNIIHANSSISFKFVFLTPGIYNIVLKVYTEKRSRTADTNITVDVSVTGLFLSSDGVAKVNDTVNFVVLCASKGRRTYFEVDFGDQGTKVKLTELQKITKDFRNDFKNLGIPFNPIGFIGVIFNYTYSKIGTYNVTVNTMNSTSSQNLTNQVEIAKAPCPLPKIKIFGGRPDYKNAPEVPFEIEYTFYSDVKVFSEDCKKISIDFTWTIFKADEYLLKRTGSSLPPREDLKFILKIRTNQSTLTIPRKTLPPRLYIFQLRASFPAKTASSIYIVYLRIQRPPLIVKIAGGSARSIAWNENFHLDSSESIDPLTKSSANLTYEWRCTRKDKSDSGGCFGGGEILSKYNNKKVAEFREKLLDDKITYQFTVIVSTEDGGIKSSGNYTQEIKAIPGKPPLLKLRCISNCASLVNPDSRISLVAECNTNCVGLTYKWSLENTTSSLKHIWFNKTLTPIDSASLVVKAGTFKPKHTYIFRLDVKNNHDKSGFVSYKMKINTPPHGGHCDFMPKEGFSMSTHFNFSCSSWTDDTPGQPLFYKLFYSSLSDSSVKDMLLYHGPRRNRRDIRLPSGEFKIMLRVEDVFKAYRQIPPFFVKVKPSENGAALNSNATLEVDKLFGSGDIQAANRYAVALMSEVKNQNASETKTKILSNIVESVFNKLPDNLDSMRQSMETIVLAVHGEDNVPPQTQTLAMTAFLRTSEKLKSEAAADIGNDVVEDIARGLLTGVGNIMEVSSHSVTHLDSENNTEVKKEQDEASLNQRGITKQALNTIKATTNAILEKKVKDEDTLLIETKNLQASIQRANSKKMNGSSVQFSGNNTARVTFPNDFRPRANNSSDDPVDVVVLYFFSNPHASYNTSNLISSSCVSMELSETNGRIVKVQDLSKRLEIKVPRTPSDHEISENKTTTKLSELVVHILKRHSFENAFVVEVCPESNISIVFYFRNASAPTLTSHDFNETLFVSKETPNSNSTGKIHYFIPSHWIDNMTYYVGVASQINGQAVEVNYTFRSYELGCYYWNAVKHAWTTDGCTPGKDSTNTIVQCLCNHATLFGSNFFVAPNSLDIKKEILNFSKLGEYPALIAAICVIMGLYIIGMVWAKRKDRQLAGKDSLHVAVDNDASDTQRYEVTVFTGSRRNAGSTAEASLLISGENGESDPRLLQRTSPISFKRSSQDSYLVTTSRSLGPLLYIRIWHDNSGSDPSWFLSEIIIRDVESGQQYFFVCNSWLACDEGDGLVERLIPVASPEELKDFQYLFMQNSSQGFSDGHLWFSIFLRPAQSRFTHAQRVSCCLCLLLCTMLTNAMFFKVEVAAENNVDVDVGPYEFTWHEVIVGIQSSIIVFPINLLIVGIFRRIAARPRKSSKYLTGKGKCGGKTSKVGVSLGEIELKNQKKAQKINGAGQSQHPDTQIKAVNKKWLFPWWFVYVTWILLILVSLTAGFFTLLYGIKFGKRKQEQWLTALVISVFQDVLVSQPIKIFAFSLFIAFVIRKPTESEVNKENDELMQDEAWIQESLYKANPDGIAREKPVRKPPDELVLKKMRLFRLKERKMFQVFREVIQYFFFWWIILMIAYGYREPDAHIMTTSMEKIFVDLPKANENFMFKRDSKHDLFKMKSKRNVLDWIRDVIIPGLYHEKWYNNKTDRTVSISDGVGYLIGSARLRQLRIKKDSCKAPKEFDGIIDGCESDYSFSKEYQVEYNTKDWTPSNASLAHLDKSKKWQYQTQSELYERPFFADLATYRGGGYVIKLKKTQSEAEQQIKELNRTWWIDEQTRAVFVEFTVFSPNKNLHCIVTIYFECPAAGGCSARYQIQTTRLDELIGNYRLFVLGLEFLFLIIMVAFTYKTMKAMIKQGAAFWKMFWNWIEMAIISVGWTCVAFYILRYIANTWTKSKFHDNRGEFVSFRYVATADQLYGVILAFLLFFTSIKFLRLFRFNRRMSLLGSTLKFAAWDLFNFFFLFAIAFVACACVAYLLFQNDIDMFSSILNTMQTLLNIILGKFKYMNLSHDTFVASAVVLVVYVIIVVFVLVNVFLVILNDAFKVVKQDNDLQENEHEIVDYITGRFKSWIGIKSKPSKLKSDFEHEYGFKPTYVPPEKYQVPATVLLDRKVQELSDFLDKQAYLDDLADLRVDAFKDEDSKKKAILLLML